MAMMCGTGVLRLKNYNYYYESVRNGKADWSFHFLLKFKKMDRKRREFLKKAGIGGAGLMIAPSLLKAGMNNSDMFFKISIAEWSLHKMLFAKELTNLEFPGFSKKNFDIHAVEYVNQFFKDAGKEYLTELKTRTDDLGVENVLIMVDAEGNLGEADDAKRQQAVENHYKWVEAAKFLGCHSIRVNARGKGTMEEVAKAAVDGLGKLSEYASKDNIGVIVENHGGYSSNGKWMADVIRKVNHPNCGMLPDFGNFRISGTEEYDRYLGMKELMPFAKGVSAKSHEFDEEGNETKSDFYKILKIVKEAGYTGFIGIEYEGRVLSEVEGVMATKRLLEKVGRSM